MKRLILALVASTLLAAPAAQAQGWNGPSHGGHQVERKHVEDKRHQGNRHDAKRPDRHEAQRHDRHVSKPGHYDARRHGHHVKKHDRHHFYHKRSPSRWHRGDRLPGWHHRMVVRDYYRYGLHRPPYGQHWVKVDNHYLLVGVTSGIIAGLIATR